MLAQQKDKLHSKAGSASDAPAGGNIFSAVFEKFVLAMVVYFVVSILNSLAQARRPMLLHYFGSYSIISFHRDHLYFVL